MKELLVLARTGRIVCVKPSPATWGRKEGRPRFVVLAAPDSDPATVGEYADLAALRTNPLLTTGRDTVQSIPTRQGPATTPFFDLAGYQDQLLYERARSIREGLETLPRRELQDGRITPGQAEEMTAALAPAVALARQDEDAKRAAFEAGRGG